MKIFLISGGAHKTTEGKITSTYHGWILKASSDDESVGVGHRLLKELKPETEGWVGHSISAMHVKKSVLLELMKDTEDS